MGKGRAPCCDKTKVKRGPWSPEEDMKLISFINNFGHENWRSLPKQAGLLRCGKSCRLRWINYLRPDVKRGNFTAEEEDMIIKLHKEFGNKWSKIASKLPGRTDNEIKNVWHTHLKKRLNQKSSRTESISSDNKVEEEGSLKGKICQELSTSMSSSGGSNLNLEEDHDLQIGLTFEYIEAYNNTEFTDIIQEVDKPDDLLEIPFDSDPEIWSFLDSSKSNSSGSRVEEESDEDEVKKWFKHLESELGLEEDDNNQKQHKQEIGDVEEEEESSLLKTYELMIH